MDFYKLERKMSSRIYLIRLLLGCVCILIHTIVPCGCTSTGASSLACVTLIPQHGSAQPQSTSSPYTIQLQSSQAQYMPGGRVVVSLTGPSFGFKGFIMQARLVGQTRPVGTWENLPLGTKVMRCQGSLDTVTHTNSQSKNTVTLTWRAPNTDVGTVEFVATVVQSYATFWGPIRSTQLTASHICTPNPCQNGGTCTALSSNAYRCECRVGTEGSRCQTILQVPNGCSSSPCFNSGACTTIGSSYRCSCSPEFTGSQCQTRAPVIQICSPSPCHNGATCTSTGTNTFRCTCRAGTSGPLCETIVSPCTSNPCLNGGQCSIVPGTTNYQCSCSLGYSGTRCQTTPCSSNPCLNGAQCSLTTGTSGYRCICLPGYDGVNCQILNPCSPNPCLNGGSCSTSSTTFTCQCADGWTGVNCATQSQAVCASANICQNGGTCLPNAGGSFTCGCAEGFNGVDCSNRISPCFPNPCSNGGSCAVTGNSSFKCSCPATHSGITCQVPDLCSPSPCRNGVCRQAAGDPNYSCSCNPGYTGATCDVQELCNPNPCVNGVCTQDDVSLNYSCQCNIGFKGRNCDQPRQAACQTNPCMNGLCLVLDDGFNYECACQAGYKGTHCQEAVDPVFQNCPSFQILTFPLSLGQRSANIPLRLSAIVPGAAEVMVEVTRGPEIPGIVPYIEEYRTGKEMVVKATSAANSTAECHFLIRMIDEEPPTVTCPPSFTKVTFGSSMSVVWPSATATDNLASSLDINIQYSIQNGSDFQAEEEATPMSINVTARDTFSNVGFCKFQVTVVKIPNAPLPVFSGCRDGQTVSYQLRNNTDIAYVSMNIQARDSSQQPAIITKLEGPDITIPGDVKYTEAYRQGQKFIFRALDPVTELTTDCTFWIKMLDRQPPIVRCPPNIIERTTADQKVIYWPPVEVQDNLPLPEDNSVRFDRTNGTVFDATANGLSHIVTVTAMDSFDNVGTCQFSVSLYKFGMVCSEFPLLAVGTSNCDIAADGKKECRVSCDQGFEYAPVDNRFKCQIRSTNAFWEPAPNVNGCSRPSAGSAVSKTVTAAFPFNGQVCDKTNRVFVSSIQTSIQSSLRDADLCERGVARACEPNSVLPKCGIVTGSAGAGQRKRRALTDLTVEIKVSAPTQGASLSNVKQDVEDLAESIKDLADEKLLFLIIDSQTVSSLSSSVLKDYNWACPQGFKSTPGGCVSCPPGTYLNSSRQDCLFCDHGYYQHTSGQTSCIQCGTGESTLQMGSASVRQCQSETEAVMSIWSPILISVVAIAIAFLLVLVIGALCVCFCLPTAEDRRYSRDRDGSLSNLKYLNKAYEDQYTKRRSVVGVHRLSRRQTSPSRASTATGYITMSSGGRSSSQTHVDMVSIDSDDYHQDGHFNHGNDIGSDVGKSYGHVSTATLTNNKGRFNAPANQPPSNVKTRRELSDTGL